MSKASRSEHYQAIAEFYGRMLVEDMRNPAIPDFVLAHAGRRAGHFALVAIRLAERRRTRTAMWQGGLQDAISPASLS